MSDYVTFVDSNGECSRAWQNTACEGELFERLSRSGLSVSTICEGHAAELEATLDAVADRYPEVNHHDSCTCYGCTGNEYINPEAYW